MRAIITIEVDMGDIYKWLEQDTLDYIEQEKLICDAFDKVLEKLDIKYTGKWCPWCIIEYYLNATASFIL